MKVFLDMVGCRLNQSELENFARQFRLAGHTLAASAETADLVVINTCTVTAAAASDSRQKIRHAARSGSGQVVVTGCWATMNPLETSNLPGVSLVVLNEVKDDLVSTVLNLPSVEFKHKQLRREPIPGSRLRTRAFIKVQDGCDNHCTYCITRIARGAGKSRTIREVVEDIQAAMDGGAKEVVLTGVHLGSWGYDFPSPSHLDVLVRAILADTAAPRLRLSSLEPWDISPRFFELWQDARLCRHLHLPLQSGSEATLKRMGRRVTPQSFKSLVDTARSAIPGIAITTDIITGFPGETEAEFSESVRFIDSMDFSNGHVFTYSARQGTPAAAFPHQVPFTVAKQRNNQVRELLTASAFAFLQIHIGQHVQVLWEKALPGDDDGWQLSGLSDNYLRVRALSPFPYHNQVMQVKITGVKRGELDGVVIADESLHSTNQDTL